MATNRARKAREEPEAFATGDSEWISLASAAKLLHTHRETILKLGLRGIVRIEARSSWTFVRREDIERLAAEQAK